MSASERILALIHRELDKEKPKPRDLGSLARAYQVMKIAEGDTGAIDLEAISRRMREIYPDDVGQSSDESP